MAAATPVRARGFRPGRADAMIPCGMVVARGTVMEALAGYEAIGSIAVMVLILLAEDAGLTAVHVTAGLFRVLGGPGAAR